MFGVISGLVIGYRIFDALNDPFMGVIIEKVHFKTGKYKPWILIGGLSNAIVVFALFVVPSFATFLQGWGYVAWFAVFYLLWGLTFTMNDIAYWSLLPSLTSDEKQRNSITTIMSIFCSVGQFAVAGLAPIISGKFGYTSYIWISIIVAALFAISQTILYFGLIEHKRDVQAELSHPQPHFKDMFEVIKKNDQVKWMTIILFLYYLGSGILNALGLNYFYFAVNFSVGSTVMTIFTIVYALGMIISQFSFPALSKHFTRNQLIKVTIIATIVGYLAFFIYGLNINGVTLSPSPLNADGSMNIWYVIPLCVIGLVIFAAQGLFYLILIIMMTNTIEYNEWKFGERKESVIFSLRPLTTKLASALQQGVLYLFLIFSSLLGVVSSISSLQSNYAAGSQTAADLTQLNNDCDTVITNMQSSQMWSVAVYKIGVAILPMILIFVSYLIIKRHYKIDEKTYQTICDEIKARKATSPAVAPNETVESVKKDNGANQGFTKTNCFRRSQ